MNTANKPNLPGWVIVLMVILFCGSTSGAGNAITNIRRVYEPYFAQYPSLPTAVMVYQIILFTSVCTALGTVWLLFQRRSGDLPLIKKALITTTILRMVAGGIFDVIANLPQHLRTPIQSRLALALVFGAYGVVWYLYLLKSRRVNEIYGSA